MPYTTPHLFARLRRHRGAWALALTVLLFKVVVSTYCLLDGPRPVVSIPSGDTPAVSATIAQAGEDGCFLDEGEGCHCACAHAIAMPAAAAPRLVALANVRFDAAVPAAPLPTYARSLLRPPIA